MLNLKYRDRERGKKPKTEYNKKIDQVQTNKWSAIV